jgi:hypothetical protein
MQAAARIVLVFLTAFFLLGAQSLVTIPAS